MTHRPRSCRVLFAPAFLASHSACWGRTRWRMRVPAGQQQRPSIDVVSGTPRRHADDRELGLRQPSIRARIFARIATESRHRRRRARRFLRLGVASRRYRARRRVRRHRRQHKQQGLAYIFTETDGIWTLAATLAAERRPRVRHIRIGRRALRTASPRSARTRPKAGVGYVVRVHGLRLALDAEGQAFDRHDRRGMPRLVGGCQAQTVLAGAPFAKIDGNQFGAVYAYAPTAAYGRNPEAHGQRRRLGDFFGNAIAIDGANAVIGADSAQIGNNYTQGAAYVFKNSGGSWAEQAKLVASTASRSTTSDARSRSRARRSSSARRT